VGIDDHVHAPSWVVDTGVPAEVPKRVGAMLPARLPSSPPFDRTAAVSVSVVATRMPQVERLFDVIGQPHCSTRASLR
jgi:hypothetical protein